MTGIVSMKNAAVSYLVVSSTRGSTTATIRFTAPAAVGLQVAAVWIE